MEGEVNPALILPSVEKTFLDPLSLETRTRRGKEGLEFDLSLIQISTQCRCGRESFFPTPGR
jgi:hypothetical protein